jgi:hypothetical protein
MLLFRKKGRSAVKTIDNALDIKGLIFPKLIHRYKIKLFRARQTN